MTTSNRVVMFTLEAQRFGLRLDVVERVVPAMEVTPLPGAPDIVLGVFNLGGRIIPAMNARRRFALPERELSVTDHFIVARARERTVALVADDTLGLAQHSPGEVTAVGSILPPVPLVRGVLRRPDGLVLIHDLADFLSLDEAGQLASALEGAARA